MGNVVESVMMPLIAPYQSCFVCLKGDTDTCIGLRGEAEWVSEGVHRLGGGRDMHGLRNITRKEASDFVQQVAEERYRCDPGYSPVGDMTILFTLCKRCAANNRWGGDMSGNLRRVGQDEVPFVICQPGFKEGEGERVAFREKRKEVLQSALVGNIARQGFDPETINVIVDDDGWVILRGQGDVGGRRYRLDQAAFLYLDGRAGPPLDGFGMEEIS